MEWLTNEVLFYGGIVIAAVSTVVGLVHLVVSKFKAFRLKTQLIAEYGEMDK